MSALFRFCVHATTIGQYRECLIFSLAMQFFELVPSSKKLFFRSFSGPYIFNIIQKSSTSQQAISNGIKFKRHKHSTPVLSLPDLALQHFSSAPTSLHQQHLQQNAEVHFSADNYIKKSRSLFPVVQNLHFLVQKLIFQQFQKFSFTSKQ